MCMLSNPTITKKVKIQLFEKYRQYHAAVFTDMHRGMGFYNTKFLLPELLHLSSTVNAITVVELLHVAFEAIK